MNLSVSISKASQVGKYVFTIGPFSLQTWKVYMEFLKYTCTFADCNLYSLYSNNRLAPICQNLQIRLYDVNSALSLSTAYTVYLYVCTWTTSYQ